MKQAIARLESHGDELAQNRRRATRHKVGLDATLQASDGTAIAVQLVDVSANGCNVCGELDRFRSGSFVSVGIGNNPKLGAIIRWVRDSNAGMEFLRAIPAEREEWHEAMDSQF